MNGDFLQYCGDKAEFLEQELHNAASVFECSNTNQFIQFCIDNNADLNCRNIKGKRPVDEAIKNYQRATKIFPYDDSRFIVKEKIMHAFLIKTPHIQDEKLAEILRSKSLPNDPVKHIMNYYYILNSDKLVAESVSKLTHSSSYYKKTKQEKEAFKQKTIEKANNKFNQFLLTQNVS
jgi:hypothetical protein